MSACVEHGAAAALPMQEATIPQEGTTQSTLQAKHNTARLPRQQNITTESESWFAHIWKF